MNICCAHPPSASYPDVSALATILNRSNSAVLVCNGIGNVVYSNERFTEIAGYEAQEIYGKNPRILQSGESNPEIYKTMWESILSGEPWRGHLRNKAKNNRFYWEDISIFPVVCPRQKETYFVALLDEISPDSKKDSSAAVRLGKETIESLTRVAEGVAQTFNNFLTTILCNAELALQDATDYRGHQLRLTQIVQEAMKAGHVAHNLLLFSGASCERQPLTSIDVLARLRTGFTTFQDIMAKGKLSLRFDKGPYFIRGNVNLVEHAITNIVRNAAEANSEEANIYLRRDSTSMQEQEQESDLYYDFGLGDASAVEIAVQDVGIGMTHAILAHALEPFFSTKFPGRGLGLAVVFGVMKYHQGAISICSEVHKGTTVTLRFPEQPYYLA